MIMERVEVALYKIYDKNIENNKIVVSPLLIIGFWGTLHELQQMIVNLDGSLWKFMVNETCTNLYKEKLP